MSFGRWLSLAKMLIFYGSLKHAQLKQDQKHPQVYSKTSIAVFDSTINSYAKKLQQNNIKALARGGGKKAKNVISLYSAKPCGMLKKHSH